MTALEQDIYRRQTAGYLPTCRIAFLDELFKANASILNTLLTLLNERQFDNGVLLPPTTTEGRTATITTTTTTRREACPLITVIGTANELPDSEELAAVYDRFLFRKEVVVRSCSALCFLLFYFVCSFFLVWDVVNTVYSLIAVIII